MAKTWYHEQFLKIREEVCPSDELCNQVMEAKHFIDTHYYSNIGLRDIAAKACISTFHFIRLFKKFYGITPNQYLRAVRLQHAKDLLKGGATVTTACFSVGFDSTTSFTGLFKKMTGHTPSHHCNKPLPLPAIPPFVYIKAILKRDS